ncbi:glycosyltransferase family 4 protein [Telmatospirillum sp. J64-1]|uniref:glycosyltransferase family 4 protein n=1 Tax=Telmatospirillum sp. J64-1 TaxID=2502183 RepID=UPI00115EA9DA|nr:glycosyltransferase family 4 protein [Telmatospirillum sp. J64-1]
MSDSKKNRSVLIIVENLPVPRDRRVWLEATTLAQAGWDVTVICPATQAYPKRHEVIDGIHIYRHPLPTEAEGAMGYLAEYSAALFWQFVLAWKTLFKRGFDVIHACNPPDTVFLVGGFFKLFLGKRFIFDHHDLSPELYEAKFGKRGFFHSLLLRFERWTFRTADLSIATNESFKRIAVERGGMPPERVYVVRSGPDLDKLKIIPPQPELKKGRDYLISYLGVMNNQDGVDLLLEAMRHIVRDHGRTDIHLALMGDGPELKNLKAWTEREGLSDYVTFTGWADFGVIVPMLNTADVCVCPDPYNPFNDKCTMNKILEYMALGKPVVQFDLTEGRVSAGAASLYARQNDPADMAARILELIDDPETRARMGELGRQRIEHELSWQHQAPKLLAAYDSLEAEASARRRLRPGQLQGKGGEGS